METIEYLAKIIPDRHLSIPRDLYDKLKLRVNSEVRVLIIKESWEERFDRVVMNSIKSKVPDLPEAEVIADVKAAIREVRELGGF